MECHGNSAVCPSGTSALKTLWSQWDRLEIIGGILFRKFESNDGQSTIKQMIVPQSKKKDILHYFHDIPSAGHLGVDKTLEKLKTGYYWPNMKDYAQRYCRSCDRIPCFVSGSGPKISTASLSLGSTEIYVPSGALFVSFFGFCAKHRSHERQYLCA
jgi:hypothetical protein